MYENEHIVHTTKYGIISPDAVNFVQSLMSFQVFRAFRQFMNMRGKLRKINKDLIDFYDSMNTYSENLPKERLNPSLGSMKVNE